VSAAGDAQPIAAKRRKAEGGSPAAEEPAGMVACPACGHRFQAATARGTDAGPGRMPSRLPTVLVAEDAVYFQELVRDTLGSEYRTLLVSSKEEALAALRREKIDVFLLDLSLEDDVDGRDVLREMGDKPCPILIFTARDEQEMYGPVWDELRALGADDMLIKGINAQEDLLRKVQQLLAGRT
jgi:CheY-like chemotaxis protein